MPIYGNALDGNLPKHRAHNVLNATSKTTFIYMQIKYQNYGISI